MPRPYLVGRRLRAARGSRAGRPSHDHTCRESITRSLTTFSIENKHPFRRNSITSTIKGRQTISSRFSIARQVVFVDQQSRGLRPHPRRRWRAAAPVVATLARAKSSSTAAAAAPGRANSPAKCVQLQNDPQFARGSATRAALHSHYTWDRVIDRLEREYLQADGPGSSNRRRWRSPQPGMSRGRAATLSIVLREAATLQ